MWGKTAVVTAGKFPDGAHQHNQSKSPGPWGVPSTPPTAWGSLAYKAHPNQESANSPLPLVCSELPCDLFFQESKAAVWKAPRAAIPWDVQPPSPKAGLPEGQTQPNIWILSPVKSTAGPLADVSSVPQNILAIRRHSLSNL